jgi:long-chain fatty acid transport protein
MRTSNRRSCCLALSCAALTFAGKARATDATEVPDNGSEQSGRGGAWVARASDPLAAFYNPAGLAGQPTRIVLQANFGSQRTCFTRIKSSKAANGVNDATNDGVSPGATYPKVCSGAGYNAVPQLAMTIKLTPRIGLGLAPFLTPSSAGGTSSYPEFATVGATPNSPSPGHYLLTSQNIQLILPTVGLGVEIVNRLRLGISFQWGIAHLSFSNGLPAVNEDGDTPIANDVKATLNVHDYFIPGFTVGTIWSPSNEVDLAGWFKWSSPISATGDAQAEYPYYADTAAGTPGKANTTDTSQRDCGFTAAATKTGPCGNGGNASVHIARPMEAKIGVRFHVPRKGVLYDEHLRDPMMQDLFDVEADFTWANDSAMDSLAIRFPGSLPINLGNNLTSVIPPNADIPFHYSDVAGVRVGGDWNILPDELAVRTGGFFQTPSQTGSNVQYQNLAFATGSQLGLALGATYRFHFFGARAGAIELSAGFEHVFLSTESYDGTGGIYGLTGTACNPAENPGATPSGALCSNGHPKYRTEWAVNLGTITNSINVLNAGLGYRF